MAISIQTKCSLNIHLIFNPSPYVDGKLSSFNKRLRNDAEKEQQTISNVG